jgi:hypothetical protein
MSEAASSLNTETQSAGPRPALQLLSNRPEVATTTDPIERTVARAAAVGATLGFVFTTVVVSIAGTIGGAGFGASLGLAVFIGMWSGIGAGFMFGATVPFSRHLDAAHADRPVTEEMETASP